MLLLLRQLEQLGRTAQDQILARQRDQPPIRRPDDLTLGTQGDPPSYFADPDLAVLINKVPAQKNYFMLFAVNDSHQFGTGSDLKKIAQKKKTMDILMLIKF